MTCSNVWPSGTLIGLVALLIALARVPKFQRIFHWLPIPLWCYALPMILRAGGWLPGDRGSTGWIMTVLFPVALGVLLLGVDLLALSRISGKALVAMLLGILGIVAGGPLALWALRAQLPAEAWKGVGALAATWTGGSMNMLAVRMVLNIPDPVFAPLIVVDALIAYGWMACLVAAKGWEPRLNRWLGAPESDHPVFHEPPASLTRAGARRDQLFGIALALILYAVCRWSARHFSTISLVTSTTGWTVLLVTTGALALSCLPSVRRAGGAIEPLGYPCLYLVLAALGAQASFSALLSTPVWVLVGLSCLIVHVSVLAIGGRLLRIPVNLLATASQANVGGAVSAPLVGAVYHPSLAPVGLLLAISANAVGTYIGLGTAGLCRWLLHIPV